MSNTHQKRDDKFTLCGLRVINVAIVELPEEVTCEYCRIAPPLPPPADEQAAADELDRILRNLFIRVIMTQNSRELSDGLFETAKTSIAAYSRTQTEAVLQRLLEAKTEYPEDVTELPGYPETKWHDAVPLTAIDAERKRLRDAQQ